MTLTIAEETELFVGGDHKKLAEDVSRTAVGSKSSVGFFGGDSRHQS